MTSCVFYWASVFTTHCMLFCFKTMEIRVGIHTSKLCSDWRFQEPQNVRTWIVKLADNMKPNLWAKNLAHDVLSITFFTHETQHTSACSSMLLPKLQKYQRYQKTICCSLTTIMQGIIRQSQIPNIETWLQSWQTHPHLNPIQQSPNEN